MRTIFRRWWAISRAITLVATSTSTYSWPYAVGRRGTITVIVVAMITSLRTTFIEGRENINTAALLECDQNDTPISLLHIYHNQVGGLPEGQAVSGVYWDLHLDLKMVE